MTRRDALKTMAAGLATFILPAKRPAIDLAAFCSRGDCHMLYDFRSPYQVDDWTYASDRQACVRVRPALADVATGAGRVPPFARLLWDHDTLRGWKPLAPATHLPATDSECPACQGYGFAGGVPGFECDECFGMGCGACKDRGAVPPPGVAECPACQGWVVGVHPSVVQIGGAYYSAKLYERVRALGGEFVQGPWKRQSGQDHDNPVMRFRFDGGDGLLVSLARKVAEQRVRAAREVMA